MNSRRSPSYLPVVFVLFFLSGATSLVYQVVWLRQLILIFGSTLFATSTVLATFMGGLALGAFVAGRYTDRSAASPLRVYGVLEFVIGAYALLTPLMFSALSPVYRWVWNAGGSESLTWLSVAKFVGIAVVLLPPTTLMGASLPVLARQVADDPDRIGGKVGGLYAINTFGAVAGTFLAGFVAIPGSGLRTRCGPRRRSTSRSGSLRSCSPRGSLPRGRSRGPRRHRPPPRRSAPGSCSCWCSRRRDSERWSWRWPGRAPSPWFWAARCTRSP